MMADISRTSSGRWLRNFRLFTFDFPPNLLALKLKLLSVALFVHNLFCGCGRDRHDFEWSKSGYRAERQFELPAVVDECSGGVAWTDSSFLTHNDDGEPCLYEVAYNGRLLNTICLPGARNRDWEEVTKDDSGNVYACDLGNNFNMRRDLVIYKYRPGHSGMAQQIEVSYANQTEYPPSREQQNFDCEAVFWRSDSLYLVSKNRGGKMVNIYGIPDRPGRHVAEIVASEKLARPITGAALSPSGDNLALLAYGVVYLFDIKDLAGSNGFFDVPIACLRFRKSGQSEAIWFKTDSTFYVANEGNHVFYFQPNKFGRKRLVNSRPVL